jgi:putative ABC transport system permease protein
MTHWLSQVGSVTLFNVRTLGQRRGAAIAAGSRHRGLWSRCLSGFFRSLRDSRPRWTQSGWDDVAIVLRSGSDGEMTSHFSRDEVQLMSDAPGIARDSEGHALISPELFVMINLPKSSTGTDANVAMRGVERAAGIVRGGLRFIEGRDLNPGTNEVIVGVGAARSFAKLDVGSTIQVGQNPWRVVGIFQGGGSVAESELWADAHVLQGAYHRDNSYQAVYVKLQSPDTFTTMKDAMTSNPQLKVKVVPLPEYLAEQSSMLTGFIRGIGVFIAALMALGAIFGALNTMYSAVAARTREIATLRALGFGAGAVILSVILESLILALGGRARSAPRRRI